MLLAAAGGDRSFRGGVAGNASSSSLSSAQKRSRQRSSVRDGALYDQQSMKHMGARGPQRSNTPEESIRARRHWQNVIALCPTIPPSRRYDRRA